MSEDYSKWNKEELISNFAYYSSINTGIQTVTIKESLRQEILRRMQQPASDEWDDVTLGDNELLQKGDMFHWSLEGGTDNEAYEWNIGRRVGKFTCPKITRRVRKTAPKDDTLRFSSGSMTLQPANDEWEDVILKRGEHPVRTRLQIDDILYYQNGKQEPVDEFITNKFKILENTMATHLSRRVPKKKLYSDHESEAVDTTNDLPKIAICPACGTAIGIEGEEPYEKRPAKPDMGKFRVEGDQLYYDGDTPATEEEGRVLSVQKWRIMKWWAEERGILLKNGGVSTCGLCKYNYCHRNGCTTCMIGLKTGQKDCSGTPYYRYVTEQLTGLADGVKAINDEIELLESLAPKLVDPTAAALDVAVNLLNNFVKNGTIGVKFDSQNMLNAINEILNKKEAHHEK